MTHFRSNVLLLAFALRTIAADAHHGSSPALRLIRGQAAANLIRRIDLRSLPAGVHLDPSLQQAFLLSAPNAPSLGLAAVYFNYQPTPPDHGPPGQCGLAVLPPAGPSQYVSVVGPQYRGGTALCGGVRALGLADTKPPYSMLIYIASDTDMHGNEYPIPFVLTWNAQHSTYNIDYHMSQWLQDQKSFAGSVDSVRRLISRKGTLK